MFTERVATYTHLPKIICIDFFSTYETIYICVVNDVYFDVHEYKSVPVTVGAINSKFQSI